MDDMLQLNCIMLIDDNKLDNFYHERVIRKHNAAKNVVVKESGEEALLYLRNKSNNPHDMHPEIIFLDINMPGMNGWEFITEYKKLDADFQSKMVVVMLTTSENPDDVEKARANGLLFAFKTKPLTVEMLNEVMQKFHDEKQL
jgi:CheY-like chemotaxis protein